MSIGYLLDTDWVIHYLNGNRSVIDKLNSLAGPQLAISVISLAELYEGVYYSKDPARSAKGLEDFLSGVFILGIDEETCKIFGRERGKLRQQGKIAGDFDLMIASTCLRWNLVLLTNNIKHFEWLEKLQIISTGNN